MVTQVQNTTFPMWEPEPVPPPLLDYSLVSVSNKSGSGLVRSTNNSGESDLDQQWAAIREHCKSPRWKGLGCRKHRYERLVLVPCKKRDCPGARCGPAGRKKIAERIAYGCRLIGPVSWHVLTFDTENAEEPEWKPRAVRKLAEYVKWLRRRVRTRAWRRHYGHDAQLEYGATYELTERGRLHINLLIGPWERVPQAELQQRWGARIWVKWVQDTRAMGAEAIKLHSPEGLGDYLSKLDQAVPVEWGRRVSFSRGWPKVPPSVEISRRGEMRETDYWGIEGIAEALRRLRDGWEQVVSGEWAPPGQAVCACFDVVITAIPPPDPWDDIDDDIGV